MDAPPSLWIVLDPKDGPEFAAAWREGAHDHIKDCLDAGINEAARWVVREYTPIAEVERLRAEVEALKAEVVTADEEWHRLDVEVSHFAKLADDRSAEVEALRAAQPYTVTCEPVIDSDWPEAHQVRIRNGNQRFDVGQHLETLEEAEHYAEMLRFALGIDAARAAQEK